MLQPSSWFQSRGIIKNRASSLLYSRPRVNYGQPRNVLQNNFPHSRESSRAVNLRAMNSLVPKVEIFCEIFPEYLEKSVVSLSPASFLPSQSCVCSFVVVCGRAMVPLIVWMPWRLDSEQALCVTHYLIWALLSWSTMFKFLKTWSCHGKALLTAFP